VVFTDESEPLQVIQGEEPRDHSRVGEVDIPEVRVQPVGHEPEGPKWLVPRDLHDVLTELLLSFPRAPGSALGFDDRDDLARGVVEREVREAVPGRRIVADNRNLKADPRSITEVPLSTFELGIDQLGPSLGLAPISPYDRGRSRTSACSLGVRQWCPRRSSTLARAKRLRRQP